MKTTRPASLQPVEVAQAPLRPLTRFATYVTCEISRRIYRWSRSSLRIEQRSRRSRRSLADDFPDPASACRLKSSIRRLTGASPRCGRRIASWSSPTSTRTAPSHRALARSRESPTISRDKFMDRSGCPVLLVDLNGRLGVRKEFRNRGRFVQELEALLHLESSDCPVPRLMNVDWDKGSITITFVPGDVVRELLAEAGADIRDRDIDGSYTREVDRQRIRNGRELVPSVLSSRHIEDVAAGLDAIHAAGFRARGCEVREHHPQGAERRAHLRRPGARASRCVAAAAACRSPEPNRLAQVPRPFRRARTMNALRHSFASPPGAQSAKRRVLFVINSLAGGGAERVMATLLANSQDRLSEYDIALARPRRRPARLRSSRTGSGSFSWIARAGCCRSLSALDRAVR